MLLGSLVLLIHKENTCTSKPDLLMEMVYVLTMQECFTALRNIVPGHTQLREVTVSAALEETV